MCNPVVYSIGYLDNFSYFRSQLWNHILMTGLRHTLNIVLTAVLLCTFVISKPCFSNEHELIPQKHWLFTTYEDYYKRDIFQFKLPSDKKISRPEMAFAVVFSLINYFGSDFIPTDTLNHTDAFRLRRMVDELTQYLPKDFRYPTSVILSLPTYKEVDTNKNNNFLTRTSLFNILNQISASKCLRQQSNLEIKMMVDHLYNRKMYPFHLRTHCTKCKKCIDKLVMAYYNPNFFPRAAQHLRQKNPGLNISIFTNAWCDHCSKDAPNPGKFNSVPAKITFSSKDAIRLNMNYEDFTSLWDLLSKNPTKRLSRWEVEGLSKRLTSSPN